MKEAMLIAIEGIDGAGTSTQCRLLREMLEKEGRKVHVTREPTQGEIGQLIRRYLRADFRSEETGEKIAPEVMALLYAADRLMHCAGEIKRYLQEGYIILSDRYVMSGLVYQGLHLPQEWLDNINHFARVPDVTIIVDVPVAVAQRRMKARAGVEEIFDAAATQESLRRAYLSFAEQTKTFVVDGDAQIDVVTQRIFRVLQHMETA